MTRCFPSLRNPYACLPVALLVSVCLLLGSGCSPAGQAQTDDGDTLGEVEFGGSELSGGGGSGGGGSGGGGSGGGGSGGDDSTVVQDVLADVMDQDDAATDTGTPDSGDEADSAPKDITACTSTACAPFASTPFCHPSTGYCVECLLDSQCPGSWCSADHTCATPQCNPGDIKCIGIFRATCKADGSGWIQSACPDNLPLCLNGACLLCVPTQPFCEITAPGVPSTTLMLCNNDGTAASVAMKCNGVTTCINKQCAVCTPDEKKCKDKVAMVCKKDGSGWEVDKNCGAAGMMCVAGACHPPCSAKLKFNSNVGCEYWAVDLDNAQVHCGPSMCDAWAMQYAVIIANVDKQVANIKVEGGLFVQGHQVQPGALKVLKLPGAGWGANWGQQGSGINNKAFRIRSDAPIIAYQFNPLDNVGVFSNDASLLLPTHSIGNKYVVMTRAQQHDKLRGYFTVVATHQGGPTKVTVKTTAPTLAGPGTPALAAGQVTTYKLQFGQVLNLESNGLGADLTGTRIDADHPVAVFAGHEGANAPDTNRCNKAPGQLKGTCAHQGWSCTTDVDCPITCCADHLEEQLLPVAGWGTHYVASKLWPRGKEKDVWRVLAASNGTVVQTKPPQAVIPMLAEGQWFEFESDQDFIITGNKAFQVGQFMAAANAPGPNNDTCTAKFSGTKVCDHHLNKLPGADTCIAGQCSKTPFLSCATDGDCPTAVPIACKKNADCPNIKQAGDAGIGDPAFVVSVSSSRYLKEYVFLVPDKYAANYVNIIAPVAAKTVTLDGLQLPASQFKPVDNGDWRVARLPVKPGKHTIVAQEEEVGLVVYGWGEFVSYAYPGGAMVQ